MWRQHQSQQAAPALVDYSLVHISAFFAIGHQPPCGVLLLGGMYCSGLRRDRFSSLVVDIGSGGARWPGGACSVKPNRFPEPTNIGEVGNKLFRASGTNAVEMLGNISLGGRSCTNRRDRGVYSCPVPFFLQRAVWTNNNAGNSGVQAPRPLWQENARQIFVLSRGGQISKLWSPDPHFHFVPSPLPLSTLKQKLPWSFTLVSG